VVERKLHLQQMKTIYWLPIVVLVQFATLPLILQSFFANDGLRNPTSYHQRYRRDEFSSDAPFFQWWYYAIKDLDSNTYFAFDYAVSGASDAGNRTSEGSYVMFSMVDLSGAAAPKPRPTQRQNEREGIKGSDATLPSFHKYEKWPLDAFYAAKHVQNISIASPLYAVNVLDDDTYHVTGRMDGREHVWYADGCADDLFVEWDLVIHRIHGRFGQSDFESVFRSTGVIGWNTYAHDAEVEGTIVIGNGDERRVYTFTRGDKARAYCDQNWGTSFPGGEPAIDYPWGWYYVGRPHADMSHDISIIVGTGRYDRGFPLGACTGNYADVVVGRDAHISFRENMIVSETFALPKVCSDGDLLAFNVTRDDWITYTDKLGEAQIPLHQRVHMESEHYVITLDFFSARANYNRLLFPTEHYVFSDFEGLGVTCHVIIQTRTHATAEKVTMHDFWSDDAGLEYGYKAPLQLRLLELRVA
jgi:hypothetical protein